MDSEKTQQNATVNIEEIKNIIQDMATKKVLELRKTDQSIKRVLDIMKEGEQEFIQKTGRNMTYSEIRQMFG